MQTISPSPPSQYTNHFRFLKSSLSVCVGESLAVCKPSWETTAYCYGKCSLWTVPTWNLQLKEVSRAPGLQVHPAPPCADSKMEWGPWNLLGRGWWLQGSSEKFHNKGTSVFSVSHPREGDVRWLSGWNVHQRNIHMEKTEWSNHLNKIAGMLISDTILSLVK